MRYNEQRNSIGVNSIWLLMYSFNRVEKQLSKLINNSNVHHHYKTKTSEDLQLENIFWRFEIWCFNGRRIKDFSCLQGKSFLGD